MTEKYSKPTLTYLEQIELLRNEGLEISVDDYQYAEYWLKHVSYYRLSAYWLYYEQPKQNGSPRFKPNTSFRQVTDLYDFDRNLRRLVMRGTEHVEVALRGSWAYHMAKLGHGHSYIDAQYYSDRKEFHATFAKLAEEVGKSNETYIKHYLKKYHEPALPPVWMVCEMMSFGQLSRWYSNLKDRSLRNNIAASLGFSETVLIPLIKHLTDVRNTCAHHGRLWNRGFIKPPKLAQKPKDIQESLVQDATQAPARLYNSIVMVGHIVRTVAPSSNWLNDVMAYIESCPDRNLSSMGFPENWQQRPIWKIA